MNVAVLGMGQVGATIASKVLALGHDVKVGSRSASNESAAAWAASGGARASHGSFADAAKFAELIFLCAPGEAALAVLEAAGGTANDFLAGDGLWNGGPIVVGPPALHSTLSEILHGP